ncbi:MAG: HDOD domain-containing protein [Gemmatimonadota bacterium]
MAKFIEEFRAVMATGGDLPTLPGVVLELQAALDDDLSSGERVADIIRRDPAMATRLLRVANSSAFNTGSPVSSLDAALRLLGFRQVRSICMGIAVMGAFNRRGSGLLDQRFWQHSVAVATLTRELARGLRYTALPLDELYVGGLLHDVGFVLLDQYFPRALRNARSVAKATKMPLWMTERIVLGTDHGEVGGMLLESWSLPAGIVAAVSCHHHPRLAPEQHRDAVWLTFAAETLCASSGPALAIEELAAKGIDGMLDAIRGVGCDIDAVLEGVSAGVPALI